MAIERLSDVTADDVADLLSDSERHGSRIVRRLVGEWSNGANRFDRPGEALFGARGVGRLLGVCGLNIDPYAGDDRVGRVRHLYVLSESRRQGVGQRLVLRVIQAAQGRFDDLRLHTSNPEAARLYEALGFRPSSEGVDHTHVAKVAVLLSLADPKALVRESYNRIAADYLLSRRRDSSDIALVDDLLARLPPRARVLDAGCGAGVPIAHRLAARVRVVGVDFAEVQLGFARRHVSSGLWVCADLAALPFAGASFDAVCSHYAVIHIPRDQHAGVLEGFARVLRPGGLALLCLGAADLPAWTEQYHGTPMYWSHYDAATSLSLVEAAGFEPVWHRRVADGPASHLFVLARRRDPGDR